MKIRVGGLFVDQRGVLVGKHLGHDFFVPVGGSLEVGESLSSGIEREFLEETGLAVKAGRLLFVGELHLPDVQVIDVIFQVQATQPVQPLRVRRDGSLIDACFIPVGSLHEQQLNPREFWQVFLPAIRQGLPMPEFHYAGRYER